MVFVVSVASIIVGLFVVHVETRYHVAHGNGIPLLRGIGWLIAGFGALVMLGLVTGRRG